MIAPAGPEPVHASLWIHPTGAAAGDFEHALAWLRRECPGPAFKPHLTLLEGVTRGRADAAQRLKQLAMRIPPFEVRVERIDWREERFRCLFAAVRLTAELAAARQAACTIFELAPAKPYEPHLSLLYGYPPEARKLELAKKLESLVGLRFTAESVHLVHCSGEVPVEEWRSLAENTFRPQAGVE